MKYPNWSPKVDFGAELVNSGTQIDQFGFKIEVFRPVGVFGLRPNTPTGRKTSILKPNWSTLVPKLTSSAPKSTFCDQLGVSYLTLFWLLAKSPSWLYFNSKLTFGYFPIFCPVAVRGFFLIYIYIYIYMFWSTWTIYPGFYIKCLVYIQ